jgi:sulfur-carrier protein adenylyltransferase/sulfurtransferase
MKLTDLEFRRYHRHLVLNEFGLDKQLLLKQSKVLVVGAGGLGCPVLLYLSAAGVGTIGIADSDVVEVSNLQRQVLFAEADLNKNKAIAAAKQLEARNSLTNFIAYPIRLTAANAMDILTGYDVVVDGTDNFATRYLLNDACVILDKPLIYGSIIRFEGHVSVFNVKGGERHSINYRDIFPLPPDPATVPNCEQAGVLGVLAGMIGCFQALEAIKVITGVGEPLIDRLMIIDGLTLEQNIISIPVTHSRDTIRELIDYDQFCNGSRNNKISTKNNSMKEVTVQELKEMIDAKADFQLIDVREPHEYDICDLGGQLIPQGEIPNNVDKISKDKKVVVHCRSGARSGNMVQWLEKNHGFTNLYNLKGGILAWAREIDPEMPTY